jgi:hypothetical protein
VKDFAPLRVVRSENDMELYDLSDKKQWLRGARARMNNYVEEAFVSRIHASCVRTFRHLQRHKLEGILPRPFLPPPKWLAARFLITRGQDRSETKSFSHRPLVGQKKNEKK